MEKVKGHIVNNIVTSLHIFQRSLKISGSFNHSDMINLFFNFQHVVAKYCLYLNFFLHSLKRVKPGSRSLYFIALKPSLCSTP